MNVAAALDLVFRGAELPYYEAVALRVAIKWRPWWPSLPHTVRHLRGEPVPSWYRDSDRERLADALSVLRPMYEDWKVST